MSKKDGTKSKSTSKGIPKHLQDGLNSIAKGLGVAATELWTIFVQQYVVRGLSELFTAAILYGLTWFLSGYVGFYSLIPFVFAIALTYGAILYLGNPRYYALHDLTGKIKQVTSKPEETVIVETGRRLESRW